MPSLVHYVVTFVEFCTLPLLPWLFASACGLKKLARVAFWIAVVHIAVELALVHFGLIYSISDAGVYQRGSLYFLYIAVYVAAFVIMLIVLLLISRRFDNRDIGTIICTVLVLCAGMVPSVIDSSIKTSLLAVAVAAVLTYVYYEGLTSQVMQQQVAERNARISQMQESTIIGMANLIERRSSETGTHVKSTAHYVELLARAAEERGLYAEELNGDYIDLCVKAAPLHDVGKIVVPDAILNKPGPLTPSEFEQMKQHATQGAQIVEQVLEGVTDKKYLEIAKQIAGSHHEKWDGSGYPQGLAGTAIPLCARIMAVADVYDALSSKRTYKDAMSQEEALGIIREGAGTHFDPQLAPLFAEVMAAEGDV